jgi:hypothetical protein
MSHYGNEWKGVKPKAEKAKKKEKKGKSTKATMTAWPPRHVPPAKDEDEEKHEAD